jgi:hypothetical protein
MDRARARAKSEMETSSDIKSRVSALKDAWLRGGEKCKSSVDILPSKEMSRKVKVDVLRLHDANDKLMVYSWNRRKRREHKILGQNQRTQSEGHQMHMLTDESRLYIDESRSYMSSPDLDREHGDSAEKSMIHLYAEGANDGCVMEEAHLNAETHACVSIPCKCRPCVFVRQERKHPQQKKTAH